MASPIKGIEMVKRATLMYRCEAGRDERFLIAVGRVTLSFYAGC